MKIFCDSSVFVASALQSHPHHSAAIKIVIGVRDGADTGHTSAHALAETFSVLSRIPTEPKLSAQDVLQILETNIIPFFHLISLPTEEYPALIRDFVARGFSGGAL
jgi:predicted nucleic acid-binding protein